MPLLKIALIVCAVAYLVAAAGMFFLQRQLQYFPSQNNPSPSAVGLSGVNVENLVTSDGETLVMWYAAAVEGQPTLLYFQGNAGEISDRADRFAAYRAAGFGVAFLSWRGFGGSTGTISETGFLIDAQTAYEWLIAKGIAPETVVAVGESLGTGVAVQLAADRQVGAVVLGAPYAAAVDIAKSRYPWLPVRFLMKDQFHSIDFIGAITAPILIQHGTEDLVIPFAEGQRLYEAAVAPAIFKALEGKGHEALYQPATWGHEIAFVQDVFGP
ncbi:Alpha/beta hydrolase family protein [Roseovarius albus]|uniref:Alpha/beta hydrolase family protein n=1 Tax=Roseovarius albus TaxID=1247867 RepID=A0A1X6YJH3_9RHOB|nr:alpha/beta hydrolase [Roseovarius albus]SLN23173.1 Alpha/beta hydrolase family protein [Roseovarius albus]